MDLQGLDGGGGQVWWCRLESRVECAAQAIAVGAADRPNHPHQKLFLPEK